jgi:hypothetical protein
MTNEQKAVYIGAQTALMLVELEEMKAANCLRDRQGYAQAYDDIAFAQLFERYEKILGHNAVLELFQS